MDQTAKHENALPLEQGDLYRFIFNQAADSIVTFDTETLRFVEFNDAACRELGYTRDEFANLRLTDIQAVLTPDEVAERLSGVVKAGGGTFELQHRRKNGSIRHCRVSNQLVKVNGRNLMVAVWIDITDRKLADARLDALNRDLQLRIAEMEAIFNTVPIGIAIAEDPECLNIRCNPALAEMLAVAPDENCSKSAPKNERPQFLVFQDGRELTANELPMQTAIARAAAVHNMETDILHASGRIVQLCGNAAPLFDDQGNPCGAIGAFWDVGKQKRTAAAMKKAAEAAQAANRAKSEFLANISHEIRTPMTSILGFADLLLNHDLSREEQREFLHGIRRNGAALLELINDILDLSQIEADKLTIRKSNCPLWPIVYDIAAAFKLSAEKKGIEIRIESSPEIPETIHTDAVRLRQILMNLVGNAVKFTEAGEIRIFIRCQRDDSDRPRLRFAVSDTGCGIHPDALAKLFQPFTQADASFSRRHGGAGLGLAISKRLAAALGGQIEVKSTPGFGSTFTLVVDATPAQNAQQHLPSTLSTLPSSNAVISGRLLLVEDDADIQRILRLFLKKTNVEVEVAENGRKACEFAEASQREGRPYDLILMDIQMPEMNGYEATRELRRRGWPGRIVALTAHAMAGDREKCLAAGCDDYIAKPAVITGLRDILARHLAKESKLIPDP